MLSRMRSMLSLAVARAAALLFVAGQASAQSSAATLSGTIQDPSGASVPNAKITITNRATHMSRTIETNDTGVFVVPDVDQGVYDVSVEKAGRSEEHTSELQSL